MGAIMVLRIRAGNLLVMNSKADIAVEGVALINGNFEALVVSQGKFY